MTSQLIQLRDAVINWVYPLQCLMCRERVSTADTFCGPCWGTLHFIHAPFCTTCSTPLPYTVRGLKDQTCAHCLSAGGRSYVKKLRAVWGYNPASARLILHFKNHDASHLLPLFVKHLLQVGEEILAETDVLAPIPLHWSKLWLRQFNQAGELARALSQATGIHYAPDLLHKRRGREQKTLSGTERRRNVADLYYTKSLDLRGQRITLIDDVSTTGWTLEAAAKALCAAGAESVQGLVLARTVKTEMQIGSGVL